MHYDTKRWMGYTANALLVFGTFYSLIMSLVLSTIHLRAVFESVFYPISHDYNSHMAYSDIRCPLAMSPGGSGEINFKYHDTPYTFHIEQGVCPADSACNAKIDPRSGNIDTFLVYNNSRLLCTVPLVGPVGLPWRITSGLVVMPGLLSITISNVLRTYALPPRKKKRRWPGRLRTSVVLMMVAGMLYPIIVPRSSSLSIVLLMSGALALWFLLVGIEMAIHKLRRSHCHS